MLGHFFWIRDGNKKYNCSTEQHMWEDHVLYIYMYVLNDFTAFH